ncbi:hypothetical protein CSUIS_a0009 (plasmid) [Campylobacter porcelli]|uniref:Uncharacterized protein n=1 Tax=Campylobacter porcelli TaxID=1660073 RepID=A0A1X9SZ04_9BACT|nr:hypothetical protein CSUIS_a0009 [Campylobacter sp. RM6137]
MREILKLFWFCLLWVFFVLLCILFRRYSLNSFINGSNLPYNQKIKKINTQIALTAKNVLKRKIKRFNDFFRT